MHRSKLDPSLTSGGMRLVAAKLTPRLGTARFLARPRLIEMLDRAVGAKLVVVRAPAGFGKTTFLVEYHRRLQQRGVATAWLTLDEADNDVSRFLSHVLAAFQAIDPTLALITPSAGERDVTGAALDLIHHLSMQTRPFALFLDNLEAVQAAAVMGVIRSILDALPVGGQVIVGSRESPKLGLGRLRAHGHLVEVTQEALRFSLDESAALLRGECRLDLDDRQIRGLHGRTQGWAAALWLAALALREHDDPEGFIRSFSGSHAAVADYLLDDVLSRLPEESRDFLLDVSVLDDLNPSLCDAITGHRDSLVRLASFEKAGLFVIPQGPEGGSYRFHPLFRDFLCGELARSDPGKTARLTRTAADWYLERGQPVSALEHMIRSGDVAASIELLREHAEPLLWQGRVFLLAKFFDRMPGVVGFGGDARLKCGYGWALVFTHRYAEALSQLDQVEAHGSCDEGIRAELAVQRAFILAMTDQVWEALAAWEACAGQVSAEENPFAHSLQQNSHAFCLIAANRFEDARAVIAQGMPSHRQIGSSFNLAVGACLDAAIDLARGAVRPAIARCRAALASATTHPGQHASGSTIAAAFLAEACYAGGQLDEAERLLDAYLAMIDDVAAPDQLITSRVTLARIAYRRGERGQAADQLDLLERKGRLERLPRLCGSASLERARMALLDGDLEAAKDHLLEDTVPDVPDPGGELSLHANDIEGPVHASARIAIHDGRAAEAIGSLERAIAQSCSQGRLRRAHHLRVLLAMALDCCGFTEDALQLARELSSVALTDGLSSMIEDEGPKALELFERARTGEVPGQGSEPAMPRRDLVSGKMRTGSGDPDDSNAVRVGREALTPKEVRVLLLLAEGHSNRVIAERMFVSESTVKTHLRSINAKLCAENRTHAVAIARRLGILEPN
ncbi:LuxR C-terminal-related transcriptional regulator [Quisquiliibacterium transsilvanicum]|uniref:LuxR family maltose regulon positive regulatory protein n=1 Tax=Quisquiliibacterium transsilvanicum TaxID=1549638 RepID=A0A7W8HIP0_9BURK|nr:LuxR C-terminal-related transcriptional regulator [Quisquiliibacterium transsilvanicum]MBB5272769.1 LuxR family maltose regulon positive regulatory protein [Quisquiliibacterium transsilvanicum]